MTIDRLIFAAFSLLILLTVALTQYHHPYWILASIAVGIGMLQAGLSGFCLLAGVFGRLGARRGQAFG